MCVYIQDISKVHNFFTSENMENTFYKFKVKTRVQTLKGCNTLYYLPPNSVD